jgi:hypothetical protein
VLAPLALSMIPGAAAAHIVSDRDLRVFAQLPSGFAAQAFAAFTPDSLGYVRPNATGAWANIIHQRPAMLLLVDAVAHSDTVAAERAWSAIDRAWFEQRGDGGYDRAGAVAADTSVTGSELRGEAAWMAALARAQIATTNSAIASRFMWRHALLLPKFKHTMEYLEARQADLLAADSSDAGGLLVTAAAFLLAEGMFHDVRYGRIGHQALTRALTLQRSDGLLPCLGREDLAHHAIGLESLQSIAIYFPSVTLDEASRRAAEWLRTHTRTSDLKRLADEPARVNSWKVGVGEIEFVLKYAAIKPPPVVGAKTPEPEN